MRWNCDILYSGRVTSQNAQNPEEGLAQLWSRKKLGKNIRSPGIKDLQVNCKLERAGPPTVQQELKVSPEGRLAYEP